MQNENRASCEVWNGKGLKNKNEEFMNMVFVDKNEGFLLGTNYSDEIILNKKFNEQNAVIYKTEDGGKSWTEHVVGKGYFIDGGYAGKMIYAIANTPSSKYYGFIDSSSLYSSFDSGMTWKLVNSFPNLVKEIKFVDSRVGFAILKDQTNNRLNWKLMRTLDGGANWEICFQANQIEKLLFYEKTLWLLFWDENNRCSLLHFEIDSCSPQFELLPEGFKPSVLIPDLIENKICLAGGLNDSVFVLRRDAQNMFTRIPVKDGKDLFVKYTYVSGKKIALILGEIRASDVKYSMYISKDFGKTFDNAKLLLSSYVSPACFAYDNFWSYSGAGRIQHLQF
ncbi:MAG TPA: hypothetical protein VNS50_08425 [Ginsengibacter sp.]|nr:hypothetical protein [Ginsengibacter sp.]